MHAGLLLRYKHRCAGGSAAMGGVQEETVMGFLEDLKETIALYYQTNTELALWLTIGAIVLVFLLIMLVSPGFRRFMAVVIVISLVLGALLANFGQQVVRGL